MSSSHPAAKNNPLLPYWSRTKGGGPFILKSPNNIHSAIHFLRSLPPTPSLENMVRRCQTCHRFVTGAPDSSLDHGGVPSGSACSLDHHPSPCNSEDLHGQPCTHYEGAQGQYGASRSADNSLDAVSLQQRIEQLEREREEESRRADLLQMANNNLRDSQARLHQTNLQLSSNPVVSSPATTMVTATTTSVTTAPRMGIGYSTGWAGLVSSVPTLSSIPPTLAGAAANHVVSNRQQVGVGHQTIPGYSGQTIPELRSDPQVNAVAQQVMSMLMREIPALAPAPTATSMARPMVPPVAPPVAPAPAPTSVSTSAGGPFQQLFGGFQQQQPVVDPGQQRLDLLQRQLDELRLQQQNQQPPHYNFAPAQFRTSTSSISRTSSSTGSRR